MRRKRSAFLRAGRQRGRHDDDFAVAQGHQQLSVARRRDQIVNVGAHRDGFLRQQSQYPPETRQEIKKKCLQQVNFRQLIETR